MSPASTSRSLVLIALGQLESRKMLVPFNWLVDAAAGAKPHTAEADGSRCAVSSKSPVRPGIFSGINDAAAKPCSATFENDPRVLGECCTLGGVCVTFWI